MTARKAAKKATKGAPPKSPFVFPPETPAGPDLREVHEDHHAMYRAMFEARVALDGGDIERHARAIKKADEERAKLEAACREAREREQAARDENARQARKLTSEERAELSRGVRASLSEVSRADLDAREALNAMRLSASATSPTSPFAGLLGPLAIDAAIHDCARDIRMLSRSVEGDDTEAYDMRDALARVAVRLESISHMVELTDIATAIALGCAS